MSDWIGLLFFIILAVAIFIGLKILSKPRISSEQEFEKNASEGSSPLAAFGNALHGMLNPGAEKGRKTIIEMKKGSHSKKKSEGKAIGGDTNEEEND